MKLAWTLLLHLLGLACIAADIAVIATMGQFASFVPGWLPLNWMGWLAVGFFWMLALGVATCWLRILRQPVLLIMIGFYVMGALALIGFGFSTDLTRPSLLVAAGPLALAIVLRIAFSTGRRKT